MRDYGYDNLINLGHPTAITAVEPTYRNERQRMASEAGLGFIECNHLNPLDFSSRWQVSSMHSDEYHDEAYNSTKIEYFNLTGRPITVSSHDGIDVVVRHTERQKYIGEKFLQQNSGQPWFIIRRTEKIDLTAFCYKAGQESGELANDNLLRAHHFLMRNNVNPPIATPYRQALLEFIRKLANRDELNAETIVLQSFLFVSLEQLTKDRSMYVFDADLTLTVGKYLPVDEGTKERLFELQATKGGMDHPTSAYALRQSGKGIFSLEHKFSAGVGIRCRLTASHNQENSVYWVVMGNIVRIPVVPPRGLEKEGIYISTQDPITGNVSEMHLPPDPDVLNSHGIFLHKVEASGKAAEFRSQYITETEASHRLREQEEKTKLATQVAVTEAEQKLEAAKAKAKATEDALRTDKIKLISVVIGAVASTFIALVGVIKLLTPSKSPFSYFSKI